MNLLHISPNVPSVHASHAGGVCMGKIVETLNENNNVYILSFINGEFERKLSKEYDCRKAFFVKSNTIHKIVNTLLHLNKPNYFAIRSSLAFTIRLIWIIKKYNIEAVHAEFTSMGQYYWIKKMFPNIKFMLVEHDVTLQSYKRKEETSRGLMHLYSKWQCSLVEKREKKYCNNSDGIFTFNEKDKGLLSDFYGLKNVELLVPYFGVDFNRTHRCIKKRNSLCFVGLMSRIENEQAAMRLIKIFKQMNRTDYYLSIIGAHPTENLLKQETDNIHITGFVDDINEEILKHEIAVFPLELGAGIKLKVLLSFGLGLPVITTSIGAEGIDEEGKVIELVNTDEEIMEKIEVYLSDKQKLHDKSLQSIDFVQEKFNWDKTSKIFERIYN